MTFETWAAFTAASAIMLAIRKPGVQKAVNRTGGSMMIAAGIFAAGWKKEPA